MPKKATHSTPAAPTARDIASITDTVTYAPIEQWKLYKDLKFEAFTKQKEAFANSPKKENTNEPKLSDFGIEDARVRRHLDKYGLNNAITKVVNELKEKYKPAEGSTSVVPRSQEDEDKRNAVLTARVRIGNMVPECIRMFSEEIANDIIHIAIESALCSERKIVHESYIFDSNCNYIQLSRFRNLYENLPAFTEMRTKYTIANHKHQIAVAAKTYLSEFSRYITTNGQQKFQANRDYLSDIIDEKIDDDERADDAVIEKDTRFTFYVKKMLKVIRESDSRCGKLRFSKHLIPFINDIIIEFISLVAVRALVQINIAQAETVSESVVRTVIVGMLATPAALSERVITSIAMQSVEDKVTEKTGVDGATVTVIKQVEKLVASIATPSFITYIDTVIPRASKVKHQHNNEPKEENKPLKKEKEVLAPVKETPTPVKEAPKAAKAKPKEPTLAPKNKK